MTTIAADLTCMAADTQSTASDVRYSVNKIERVGTSIVGCAGPASWCRQFLAWRRGERTRPRFSWTERFQALVLDRTGLYVIENDCVPDRVLIGKHAIGSGGQAALAILHYGGAPLDAVSMACMVDPCSGGPVTVLRLS